MNHLRDGRRSAIDGAATLMAGTLVFDVMDGASPAGDMKPRQ
jgi:hypothetical protein